jgi:hypothetical protein
MHRPCTKRSQSLGGVRPFPKRHPKPSANGRRAETCTSWTFGAATHHLLRCHLQQHCQPPHPFRQPHQPSVPFLLLLLLLLLPRAVRSIHRLALPQTATAAALQTQAEAAVALHHPSRCTSACFVQRLQCTARRRGLTTPTPLNCHNSSGSCALHPPALRTCVFRLAAGSVSSRFLSGSRHVARPRRSSSSSDLLALASRRLCAAQQPSCRLRTDSVSWTQTLSPPTTLRPWKRLCVAWKTRLWNAVQAARSPCKCLQQMRRASCRCPSASMRFVTLLNPCTRSAFLSGKHGAVLVCLRAHGAMTAA